MDSKLSRPGTTQKARLCRGKPTLGCLEVKPASVFVDTCDRRVTGSRQRRSYYSSLRAIRIATEIVLEISSAHHIAVEEKWNPCRFSRPPCLLILFLTDWSGNFESTY